MVLKYNSAPIRVALMGLVLSLWGLSHDVDGAVVFNQIPSNLDLSYDSYSFAANHSRAMGNYVQLGGTERYLNAVTVTMVTWAKQSDFINSTYADYSNAAGWNHYVEVVLYAIDNSGAAPVLNYLASSGGDVLIPWKPTVVPPGYPETETSPYPYNGFAFNLNFQFDGSVHLPEQLVVSVNYDTQNYGYEPMGVPGPFDQLNVAADSDVTPTVGTDLSSSVYVSQKTGTDYVSTLNGNSGGAAPMFKVEASATSAFEQWQATKGLSGANGAPDADPDQDGFSNLQEFIFGLDPSNAGSANPISVEPTGEGGGVKSRCLIRRGYVPRAKVFTQLQNPTGSLSPHYIIREISPQPAGLPEGYVQWEVIFDTSHTDREFLQIEVDTYNY